MAGTSPNSSGQEAETHHGQDALPSQGTLTHTHSHSDQDELVTPIHLMCTSLGCGRQLEYLEKTHADMGRMCELYAGSGPGGNPLFPPPY